MPICKLELGFDGKERGTGFFCSFEKDNIELCGLFTNNHIIDYHDFRSGGFEVICSFHGQREKWSLKVSQENFCFTNPVLDATFISLTPKQVAEVKKRDLHILSPYMNRSNMGKGERDIIVVQYPGCKEQHHSHGQIERMWGCDYFHTASTSDGASGAPLIK